MRIGRQIMPVFAALARLLAVFTLVAAGATAARGQTFDAGLLWRIERPGVAASHVFGTIHVADPRVARLAAPVQREFAAATSFGMEVMPDPAAMLQLASRMAYDDGRTLAEAAGPELFPRLVPLMGARGVPEPVLRVLRPWAVTIMLVMPQQNAGDVPDVQLYRAALAAGKPVFALETVDDQISVFEALSEAEQLAMLRYAVDTQDRIAEVRKHLLDAYLRRDLGRMWRISTDATGIPPELARSNELLERRLLHERNGRMAERMEREIARGGAFVAVGALHLYGREGLPALLAQRGWRVTRVW